MTRSPDLYLAPVPKRLYRREGLFDPKGKRYIRLQADDPQSLIPAAEKTGLAWEITASSRAPKHQVGLVIRLDERADIPDEGYKLGIRPERIEITASTPAGAFYGACTLAQITRRQEGRDLRLPCLTISDWPDFPARGLMLDISRDKVPTMETLYRLVDLLAAWKINQFQLYTEHTFAYLAHPTVWEHASPITGEEILALDAYCKERFVELVPNQNSFGHMQRWLVHDEYRPMAEAPHGCDTVWGRFDHPFSLCPIDRRSVPFIRGLYNELLPHFSSRLFNVGCDETVDLGCDRSRKVCEERGVGRVYLDFLLEIQRLAKERGRTMQFWGDIILKHPELIPELPKDVIALEWGYESDHPFLENCAKFAESGIPFYVCPGTSSWHSLVGRTDNAIENITSASRNGLSQGAVGLLNTDWGDNGHWQPLAVSYLGYMVGAMASWNSKADVRKDLTEKLSLHAFGDPTGRIGKAFHDLGNLYRGFEKLARNSSIPWQVLYAALDDAKVNAGLRHGEFQAMERRLEKVADAARGARMTAPDAPIVREEFAQAVGMIQLAAELGKVRTGGSRPGSLKARIDAFKKHHKRVWLLRNRPGGLKDSPAKVKVG